MNGTYEDVARRAYELFLARGRQHGGDMEDWLEAERQLKGSNTQVGPTSPIRGRQRRPPRDRAHSLLPAGRY